MLNYLYHPIKQFLSKNITPEAQNPITPSLATNYIPNNLSFHAKPSSNKLAQKINTMFLTGQLSVIAYWAEGLKGPITGLLKMNRTIDKFKTNPNIDPDNLPVIIKQTRTERIVASIFSLINYFGISKLLMTILKKTPEGKTMSKITLNRIKMGIGIVALMIYYGLIDPLIVSRIIKKQIDKDNKTSH